MRSERESGRTFVEVVIAAVILATTVMIAFRASDSSTRAQQMISTKASHETQVGRALTKIVDLVRQADVDTLLDVPDAPATSSSIRFRRVSSYDGGALPQLGPEERISLQLLGPEAGSVLWETGGGIERILRNVDDVEFSRRGRMLKVVLRSELEGPEGRAIRVMRTADVCIRN